MCVCVCVCVRVCVRACVCVCVCVLELVVASDLISWVLLCLEPWDAGIHVLELDSSWSCLNWDIYPLLNFTDSSVASISMEMLPTSTCLDSEGTYSSEIHWNVGFFKVIVKQCWTNCFYGGAYSNYKIVHLCTARNYSNYKVVHLCTARNYLMCHCSTHLHGKNFQGTENGVLAL